MSDFNINHTQTSNVDDEVIEKHAKNLQDYRHHLQGIVDAGSYNEPASALNLPQDESVNDAVHKAVQKLADTQPSVVIVVGMGGSSRGTKAIYQLLENTAKASTMFIDTVSADTVSGAVSAVNAAGLENAVLCAVSKSGTTAETMSNFTTLLDQLSKSHDRGDVLSRSVVITDAGSPLDKNARDTNATVVHIPDQVGGRYSVMSAIGLVPLALAGVSVDTLQNGAAAMRDACLARESPLADPAAVVAAILYEHSQNTRRIVNHFFFNQYARTLGLWSAQLFAESLGKRKNRKGEPVFAGMYPTTTIGPDDLHSIFQLQLGGPKNFVSIFVRETDTYSRDLQTQIPEDSLLADKLAHVSGHTLGDLQQALGQATTEAMAEAGRPFIDITVPQLDAYHIGQFVLLEELVVMYLGQLMNVNAFSQPEVENYKTKTRGILQDKSKS